MRIILTGATGFLGSHIAETLLNAGHILLLTKRTSSDLKRCEGFKSSCSWIDTNDENWQNNAILFHPDVIINAAWDGVSANNREDWDKQITNINFQHCLLNIAERAGVNLFVGIGSQAEYGYFDCCITETHSSEPESAYGATKLASLELLKTFCFQKKISWYWFRLFSCFGEREGSQWLIPNSIKHMLRNEDMDLTLGEQHYSYLYVKDVADIITRFLDSDANSGIYNISGESSYSIKEILTSIKEKVHSNSTLRFGAIPYRKHQAMLIQGDMTKTMLQIPGFIFSDIQSALEKTVNYYKKQFNESI